MLFINVNFPRLLVPSERKLNAPVHALLQDRYPVGQPKSRVKNSPNLFLLTPKTHKERYRLCYILKLVIVTPRLCRCCIALATVKYRLRIRFFRLILPTTFAKTHLMRLFIYKRLFSELYKATQETPSIICYSHIINIHKSDLNYVSADT